jgi:hypothetical protein
MEADHEALSKLLESTISHCFPVHKINDHNKSQSRLIVLTPTAFYNVKKTLMGSYKIRRRVPYDLIMGLVRNLTSQELVLKVASSIPNDYRYSTPSCEEITRALAELKPGLSIWTLQIDMKTVTRTKYPERNHGLVDVVAMETDRREEGKKATQVAAG